MKKIFKWLGIIIGSLLALLIIAALALPYFLPLDKIKELATAKLSETLGREVKIEKVSFNFFSGIKLEKLSIANNKDFSKKYFVSADSIELHYAFWPLFKRQLLVKDFRLVKPQILIEKNAAGAFNFSDLTKPQQAKAGAQAKPSFSLFVDTFSIRNGQLLYVDCGTNASSAVKNISLSLSGFTLALFQPIDFKFSALANYQAKDIPISLAGKIAVDLNQQIVNVPNLELNIAGEKANISANVADWQKGPAIDFAVVSKKLSLDPLVAVFAAGDTGIKERPKPGELTEKVDAATRALPNRSRVNANLDLEKLSLLNFKIDKLNLNAKLANKQVGLNIKELALYGGTVTGKASINLAASGLAYNINNLTVTNFNATPFCNDLVETFLTKLDDYKDLKNKIYGRLDFDLSLTGQGVEPQTAFANAVAQGSLAIKGGELKRVKVLAEIGKIIKSNSLQDNIKLNQLQAGFALKNRAVSAQNLEVANNDLKVKFNGGADLVKQIWVSGNRLNLKLSPSVTKDAPKEFSLFRDTAGWLGMTFELTGSLKLPIPKPVLAGAVEAVVGKLKVKIEAQKVEIEKQAVDSAKKTVEEEAKKQLKDLIKF